MNAGQSVYLLIQSFGIISLSPNMRQLHRLSAILILGLGILTAMLPGNVFAQAASNSHALVPAQRITKPTQRVSSTTTQAKVGSGANTASKFHPAAPPAEVARSGDATMGAEQPMTVYSHGDPTDEEQALLELINRARADPKAEGLRLSTTTDPDVSNAYTQFSQSRSQVKTDFDGYPVEPPLAFNSKLIAAARGHSQDMLTFNYQGHTGHDGSLFDQRINSAGYTGWTSAGENVFANGNSLWDIHASFNIDFGNPALGHRTNMMNFTGDVYTEVGIGVTDGGSGYPNVGPMITTEDYGMKTQNFILGVVYDDKNKNGIYDPGEGISGVTIKPSTGSYSAVSSTSGGYAIPFSTNGSVTITASGGTLAQPVTHTVTFNGENIKVDFLPDLSGLPADVPMIFPLDASSVNRDTVRLVWNKVLGASNYQVQISKVNTFATTVLDDATLTDSARVVKGLTDGGTYYWHVRAKNSKGWGNYSAVAQFDVVVAPAVVTLLNPAAGMSIALDDHTFNWRKSTPRVSHYWFELATDAKFTNDIVSDNTLLDSTDLVSASNFKANTAYYWRVSAENDGGWGDPSPARIVKISASGVADQTSSAQPSIAWPSPSTGEMHIDFSVATSEKVTLVIFNSVGEQVEKMDLGTLTPNRYSIPWNASEQSAGTYFYQLNIGGVITTGHIVLTK